MKNSKLRRVLLLLACAVMLVSLSVGATLAYLTSTESVKNTFTVGDVQITLDEADVKTDGTLETNERVKANEYHLMPGHSYIKDPTVTVLADSEDCYVRAFVTVNDYQKLVKAFPIEKYPEHWSNDGKEVFLLQTVVTEWHQDQWKYVGFDATKSVYEFRYVGDKCVKNTDYVDGTDADVKLDPLFQTIEIPGYLTNKEVNALEGIEITVKAEAIQADGFATADKAWESWQEPVAEEEDSTENNGDTGDNTDTTV